MKNLTEEEWETLRKIADNMLDLCEYTALFDAHMADIAKMELSRSEIELLKKITE